MGTNYFHRIQTNEPCPHCGGTGKDMIKTHIGKSSAGWTFSFYGTDEILSYEDWLRVLEAGGEIRDEYGEIVTLDEFTEMVEAKKDEELNHTTYCRQHWDQWTRRHGFHECWMDKYGHSFTEGDFS